MRERKFKFFRTDFKFATYLFRVNNSWYFWVSLSSEFFAKLFFSSTKSSCCVFSDAGFGIFSVVRFPNDICGSTANFNGTCFSESECETKGKKMDLKKKFNLNGNDFRFGEFSYQFLFRRDRILVYVSENSDIDDYFEGI